LVRQNLSDFVKSWVSTDLQQNFQSSLTHQRILDFWFSLFTLSFASHSTFWVCSIRFWRPAG
jgi:hypothetical protein